MIFIADNTNGGTGEKLDTVHGRSCLSTGRGVVDVTLVTPSLGLRQAPLCCTSHTLYIIVRNATDATVLITSNLHVFYPNP
jgi:hypothetical protein